MCPFYPILGAGWSFLYRPPFRPSAYTETTLSQLLSWFMNGNKSDTARRDLVVPAHDDVIKWKHFPRYWPFVRRIHRSPMNSPHKGQWRRALMFSLICAWINGWVNNRGAGDLRRHWAHYDITVMLRREPGLWYACYMNEAPKSYIGNEYTLLSTKVGEKINSAVLRKPSGAIYCQYFSPASNISFPRVINRFPRVIILFRE